MLLVYKGNDTFDKITYLGDEYENHTLVTKRELELGAALMDIEKILSSNIFTILKRRKVILREIRLMLLYARR